MNNTVKLSDDELSLIQSSLLLTLASHEKYQEVHGETGLDFQTIEAIKGTRQLFERLNKEYFETN